MSIVSFVLLLEATRKGSVDAFSPLKLMDVRKGARATTAAGRFDVVNTKLFATTDDDKAKRMQEILKEEASNSNSMKAAAEQMKNLKPEDMDRMLQEMDSMNPLQKQVRTIRSSSSIFENVCSESEVAPCNPAVLDADSRISHSLKFCFCMSNRL